MEEIKNTETMEQVVAENAPVITMKKLLEAGVHFGHQTRRWNPKMAEYIFTERNGIYIIDLQKTVKKLNCLMDKHLQKVLKETGLDIDDVMWEDREC